MLVLGVRARERVYVGPACVVQLDWWSPAEATLRVWEGGREAVHTLPLHGAVELAGGRVMFARHHPGDNNVKLAFDLPRSLAIKRHGMLLPARRKAICAAAGVAA